MKREIYITILLFALMLFALAVTLVQGQHSGNMEVTAGDSGYVEKTNFGVAVKNAQVTGMSNLRASYNLMRLIPYRNQRTHRRSIGTIGGVYNLITMQFETGFAGCELERPIVHRVAPFTSSDVLKSFC